MAADLRGYRGAQGRDTAVSRLAAVEMAPGIPRPGRLGYGIPDAARGPAPPLRVDLVGRWVAMTAAETSHGSSLRGGDRAVAVGITTSIGVVLVVWAGVQLAAMAVNRAAARVSPAETAAALPRLLSRYVDDPAAAFPPDRGVAGAAPTWIGVGVVAGVVAVTAVFVVLLVASRRAGSGLATRAQVRSMTARAVVRRGAFLRPAVTKPEIAEVGYRLGRLVGGPALWASVEDSTVVLGPARSGKTRWVLIPIVAGWRGPVVVTETRPAIYQQTTPRRLDQGGPVWLWDPSGVTGPRPAGVQPLAWSPVRGCEDPDLAILRATSLVDAAGSSTGVANADFWRTKAIVVLRSYLHAAAIGGFGIAEVNQWAAEPATTTPLKLLRSARSAVPSWADELEAEMGGDPDTRGNVWSGLRSRLAALASPAVLAACSPTAGTGFDPAELLATGGTVYFAGTPAQQAAAAPLIAACVEDITETARRLAAGQPHHRLDPPLLLALDEAANVAPLPSLPTLLSDGGGTGIVAIPVFQSLHQARVRWTEHGAGAMLAGATALVRLGGERDARDLEDFSRVAGEIDQLTWTPSETPGGPAGRHSQLRTRRAVPVEWLRTLPPGEAVILYRSVPPIHARFDGGGGTGPAATNPPGRPAAVKVPSR